MTTVPWKQWKGLVNLEKSCKLDTNQTASFKTLSKAHCDIENTKRTVFILSNPDVWPCFTWQKGKWLKTWYKVTFFCLYKHYRPTYFIFSIWPSHFSALRVQSCHQKDGPDKGRGSRGHLNSLLLNKSVTLAGIQLRGPQDEGGILRHCPAKPNSNPWMKHEFVKIFFVPVSFLAFSSSVALWWCISHDASPSVSAESSDFIHCKHGACLNPN